MNCSSLDPKWCIVDYVFLTLSGSVLILTVFFNIVISIL